MHDLKQRRFLNMHTTTHKHATKLMKQGKLGKAWQQKYSDIKEADTRQDKIVHAVMQSEDIMEVGE